MVSILLALGSYYGVRWALSMWHPNESVKGAIAILSLAILIFLNTRFRLAQKCRTPRGRSSSFVIFVLFGVWIGSCGAVLLVGLDSLSHEFFQARALGEDR